MRKILISFVLFVACFSQAQAFTTEDLIHIDCKTTNGIDIKTDKIEKGIHYVETNWFGLTKYFSAKLIVSKNQVPMSILLESVDQGYILSGKIDRSNPSQSVTLEVLARHPTMRLKVTDANCQLEFARR